MGKSEVVRSAEDEVAARHGVSTEGRVSDGFIARIREVDALQVDLELRRDVIVHAEVERQIAGIRKTCRAASRHIVQIEVGIPFSLCVGEPEVVAVRARIGGEIALVAVGGVDMGVAVCRADDPAIIGTVARAELEPPAILLIGIIVACPSLHTQFRAFFTLLW